MELFKLFGKVAVENSDANKSIDETTGKAEQSEGKMSSAFKKIGAAVAAGFAIDKIVNFGKAIVDASATVAAEQSAFEQIMGKYSNTAQQKMNDIAKTTGMVSTRLTPYMTSMTAKFKGLGYDISDATTLAQSGLTLAADASAFWDKSLEDAMGGLNSFINGSYEGGEAIGLFANDTQLASYAVKNGIVSETKEWASLDEARKQATRLEYAQKMMEASGATGQAAKEAGQYANVQANLTEKWRQFKAQIGEPLLQNVVLPAMSKLSGLVDKASTAVNKFKEYWPILKDRLQAVGSYVSDTLSPVWDALKDVFEKVKDAFQPLIDKFTEYTTSGQAAMDGTNGIKTAFEFLATSITNILKGVESFVGWLQDGSAGASAFKAAVVGITTAFAAYKAVLMVTDTWQKIVATTTKIVTAAQAALNIVMSANPIAIIILAIVALVAGFIYLWNNVEGFRNFWISVWEAISGFFTAVWEGIKNVLTVALMFIVELIKGYFNLITLPFRFIWENCKDVIMTIWNAIFGFFKMIFEAIKNYFIFVFNVYKTIILTVFNAIKTVITTIWNGIKTVIINVVTGIKDVVSNVFNAIKSTVTNIFEAVGSKVASVWNGIKDAIEKPINAAKDTVKKGIDAIKGFFDKLKLNFPKIKMPHFSVKGKFSLAPPSVPKLGIDWYAKGGIMNKPTMFDYNPSTGRAKVGGEAGAEAVAPISVLLDYIRTAVGEANAGTAGAIERLISLLATYLPQIVGGMARQIVLDNGTLVGELAPAMDAALGNIYSARERGR